MRSPSPLWIPVLNATAAVLAFLYGLDLLVLAGAIVAALQVGMSIKHIERHQAGRDHETKTLQAHVAKLRLLVGVQHQLLEQHGVPLPDGYSIPAAAEAYVGEYVARRERAEQFSAVLRRLVELEDGHGMAVAGWEEAMSEARGLLGRQDSKADRHD